MYTGSALKSLRYQCAKHLAAIGAQGRDRTTDTAIFSRMLYQLSYLGVRRRLMEAARGEPAL